MNLSYCDASKDLTINITFITIFAVSVLAVSFEGKDLITSFTAIAATINNIGPGLNVVGPMGNFGGFSIFSKLILSLDMLFGRLEFFPLIVLLTPPKSLRHKIANRKRL